VAIVDDILHRVDVCTVLESHAVQRAASAPQTDLCAAMALLGELDRIADLPHWHQAHRQLHRAINDAGGNIVLAAMVERMHHEVESLFQRCGDADGPLFDAHTRCVLQSQHRSVLMCIRSGLPDAGARYVRVHGQLLREQVIAALTLRV
jgi:DNA-binding FadR family transcriptional regulator